MNANVAPEAEQLAACFAESCRRMAEAAEAGRIDDALAELSVQDGLRQQLLPVLAELVAEDSGSDTARERVAQLLQQAHAAVRVAEAGLSRSRDELGLRLSVARSSATAAASYGTVDLPVSSGFRGRG